MVAESNILYYACRRRKRRWKWRFWLPASIIVGFIVGAVSSSAVILWMCTIGNTAPAKPAIESIMAWMLYPADGMIGWIMARSHSYTPMLLAMVIYFALLASFACTVSVAVVAGVARLGAKCSRCKGT